jgi:hypothetical protein
MLDAALSQVLTSTRFSFYLFALCLVLALLEIEIEGAKGWAAGLPTWRLDPAWLLRLTSGKAITGYHVWLNALLILCLHLPFWFLPWSGASELAVIGLYFLMAVEWDFLWFVLNPHFGLRRFSKRDIHWFSRWLWGFPLDYYIGLLLSLACWALAGMLEGARAAEFAIRWLKCAAVLAALALGAVWWAQVRRKGREG